MSCYVSWYRLLALWRDSCCLGGCEMRSLWTYQVKSISIRWLLPVLWVFCRLSSALYVDKGGIDVVLPSTAWRRYVHHRRWWLGCWSLSIGVRQPGILLDSKSAFVLSRFVVMVLFFHGYILSICLLCWRGGGYWAAVGVGQGVGGVWVPVRPNILCWRSVRNVSLIWSQPWWVDVL